MGWPTLLQPAMVAETGGFLPLLQPENKNDFALLSYFVSDRKFFSDRKFLLPVKMNFIIKTKNGKQSNKNYIKECL